VPELNRPEKAEPYRQQILELIHTSKGNLVRVHEELVAGGAELSYPALTGFCRRRPRGTALISLVLGYAQLTGRAFAQGVDS
jgi:hypothetical protein